MPDRVRVSLQPLGRVIEVDPGTPLRDVLVPAGVEFPCGGHGRCKGCRVRVIDGELPPAEDERRILSPDEIAAGWRLACRSRVTAGVTLEIAQWEMQILGDESRFDFTPSEGFGVAVDLGTTTLVAQLLDLETGKVAAVETALNPQTAYGSDIMSRVEMACRAEGARTLRETIRSGILGLLAALDPPPLRRVKIAGNTVMHHLFCGFDVAPLAAAPFEPEHLGAVLFHSYHLGWDLPGAPAIEFLPCAGGFVGSDVVAGIVAMRIHEAEELTGLIDLGTNGEIVFGNRERIVCASTAAGPAFEGGRIGMGMRASNGAIASVELMDGRLDCQVVGGGAPRGICGSGLVDAVACGLETGAVAASGRLAGGGPFPIEDPVALTQRDIRELQMAKGAIAAGVRIVLDRLGASLDDVAIVHLAGAFGNYINRESARRIGLLDFPLDRIHPAGNTSLLGTKLALFGTPFEPVLGRVEHISLASHPSFQDIFVDSMPFPALLP